MSTAKDKLLQYLNEAEATEQALVSTLRAHIAMTPRGPYRNDLEEHLQLTRSHAQLVRERIGRLGTSFNPLALGMGLAEAVAGQILAMGKAPLDMIRGMSLEEKLLKNAKDEYATEALEIATYTAIEALAATSGDQETAGLAQRIRRDEEAFMERLLRHLPALTRAVAQAEVEGRGKADLSTVGAADAARSATRRARRTVSRRATQAKRATTRTARSASRRTQSAAGEAATTARRTTTRARRTAAAAAGETRRTARTTARTTRSRARAATAAATGSRAVEREPWRGYDEQRADEIAQRVQELTEPRKERVKEYEEAHKDRETVLQAVDGSGR